MQAANTGDGNDILNLFSIDNDIPSTYTFYEPISVFVYFHPVVDCREICLAINFKIWHFGGLISTSALAVERQTRLGKWNVRIRRISLDNETSSNQNADTSSHDETNSMNFYVNIHNRPLAP